jgi:signal peptidase I
VENNGAGSGNFDTEETDETGPSGPVNRENQQGKREQSHAEKEIKEWIKTILISLALAIFLKSTVIASYMVPTESMVPTIVPQDRMFGNRFIYRFREPAPGDIISFTPPASATGGLQSELPEGKLHIPGFGVIPYLKRVIAVEGDSVQITNGRVYVNRTALAEPYIKQPPCYEMPTVKVPKNTIFVLGDNRCNSNDSHIWGFLPVKNVKAKVFFRFWPPNRIGILR